MNNEITAELPKAPSGWPLSAVAWQWKKNASSLKRGPNRYPFPVLQLPAVKIAIPGTGTPVKNSPQAAKTCERIELEAALCKMLGRP